jgi:hypothetical protein
MHEDVELNNKDEVDLWWMIVEQMNVVMVIEMVETYLVMVNVDDQQLVNGYLIGNKVI